MNSLILSKLIIFFSTVKLKLGSNFSQFIHRFKIGIFGYCFSWTSQFFPIQEKDGLREKCPNTEFFLVNTVFGLNTEIYGVNLRAQFKYRKIRTIKSSVFGRFSRSDEKHSGKRWKTGFIEYKPRLYFKIFLN